MIQVLWNNTKKGVELNPYTSINILCWIKLNKDSNKILLSLVIFTVIAREHACNAEEPSDLKLPSGYISNGIQSNLNCGTESTPYRITTRPGQEVVFTLYDFKTSSRHYYTNFPYQCDLVAEVIEHGKAQTKEICRGGVREKEVFRSRSNKLDIILNARERGSEQMEYLLHYEGM